MSLNPVVKLKTLSLNTARCAHGSSETVLWISSSLVLLRFCSAYPPHYHQQNVGCRKARAAHMSRGMLTFEEEAVGGFRGVAEGEGCVCKLAPKQSVCQGLGVGFRV